MTPKLILASTSRYRRELLDRLGVDYEALAPNVDESAGATDGESPDALALRLAREKAGRVAALHPEAFVIGSDQVVDLDGVVLGKPGSGEAARGQLRALAGRTHRLVTAVALMHPGGGLEEAVDVHRLTMRALDDAAIARYVAAEQPLDCAGAYKIEGRGIALFSRIEGEDFTAIVGLPMLTVVAWLARLGFTLP